MSDLSLTHVRKSFGAVDVIKGVNLEIKSGEFVVFVGPSGCGKSTLLRMIAGLEDISSGDLVIGGTRQNDVEPAKRGIAMVFQSYALYPHMTVRENMGFALRFAGKPKAEIARLVDEAARILELAPLMDRKPKQLSGGQRQRVAIGRAIVRHPQVFLFDEPLSNLDAELRVHMRIEIARLHKQLKTTIIYVTHDQVEAMTLADKIVVLRAGKVEQTGSPLDLYDNPANMFVAGFIGSPKMNFLKGIVEAVEAGFARVRLPGFGNSTVLASVPGGRTSPGDEVTLGLRPSHLAPASDAAPDGSGLELVTEMLEHLGGQSFVYARPPGAAAAGYVVAETKDGRGMAAGQRFTARFKPSDALLFDAAGERIY